MPPSGRSNISPSASSSSTPRHSRKSSKALSNTSDKASAVALHPRDRTKSSSSIHSPKTAATSGTDVPPQYVGQYHQPGEDSSHKLVPTQSASATGTRAQRPPLNLRAQSHPVVPTGGAASSSSQASSTATACAPSADGSHGYEDLHSPVEEEPQFQKRHRERQDTSDESGDDEISQDPFFQRYSQQNQEDDDEEEDEGLSMPPSARLLNPTYHDGLAPLSPMNISASYLQRPANDLSSSRSPLGSPHGPLSPNYLTNTPVLKPFQEFNIAVLGAPQVGKSTFIQRAFDLRDLQTILFTRRKMSLDGTVYVVRTIELDYRTLDLDDEKCICWPDVLHGAPVPPIDGAFILYDVMNRDSLMQIPEVLQGTCNAGIPYLLVACKCDYSPNIRPVDPNSVDEPLKAYFPDVKTFQTSESSPDTQKRCMAVMLRQMISKRKHQFNIAPNRRRANSSAVQHASMVTGLQKHNRAASEVTMTSMYHNAPRARRAQDHNSAMSPRSKSHQHLALFNPSGSTLFEQPVSEVEEQDGDAGKGLKSPKFASNMASLPADNALTLDELVNKLLSQGMSKTESKFQSIFLALYRLFASPGQLLDAIIERFDAVGREGATQLVLMNAQGRYLTVLNEWISMYPGDFAHPVTKLTLHSFIARLSGIRMYNTAARELNANLDCVVEDDDTDWACSDKSTAASSMTAASSTDTTNIITKSKTGIAVTADEAALMPHYTIQHPTNSTVVSPTSTTSPQMSAAQAMMRLAERSTKQAATFAATNRVSLTKVQWRQVMEASDEAVARELTRMDWIMFLSIRPRDLMRHVTLPDAQKPGGTSASTHTNGSGHTSVYLENVQRIVDHFNHLAAWAANLVLLRDKPKHRALILEKLMKVARELRKMNNYNALGALIAGINSASIQRLHATKELLDPAVGKDFMKLEILMSPQRSHAAYRLAWENSSGERIPYIPLHRRDLVTAESGNKTFIEVEREGETKPVKRVNWKKFEIMGEVVVGMQRAKETPYPTVPRNEEISKLVVDLAVEKDEDKLYERSQYLEPSGGGAKQRRFAWLP